MTVPISVIVPVGPLRRHSEYLIECLESVNAQTAPPDEVIVVDNAAGVFDLPGELDCPCVSNVPQRRIITLKENQGIAGGFNTGLEAARNELVFFLGSDDRLLPHCLEFCYSAWNHFQRVTGWYFVGVEYSNGFTQNTPCLAAMVPKALWKLAGPLAMDGTHIHAGCEVEYIDRLLRAGGKLGSTYRVSDDVLYWHRVHSPDTVGIRT